jgi:serine/threonine protein kinase
MAAGTPAYAAPEMLRGHCRDAIAADIWSLGIVVSCFNVGSSFVFLTKIHLFIF